MEGKERWVIKRLSQTAHYIIHGALYILSYQYHWPPCTMPINFYLSTTFTSFIFDDDILRRERSVMGDEIKILLLSVSQLEY